jgi:O-acetyl-ADP-ribose deacetylase (regulator of RNase III)
MIRYTTGDLLASHAEALVNAVNCAGRMGRGIALQFRKRYPAMAEAYAAACARGEVVPGRMFTVETGALTGPRIVVNFPTKRHWREPSLMEDVEAGLPALAEEIRARGIRSIAVPALGCGTGGLDWAAVKPRIAAALGGLEGVQVVVYEPLDAPM